MDRPSTFLVYVNTGSPACRGTRRLTSITGGQDKKQPCALIVANKECGGGGAFVDCQTVMWASVFIFHPAGAH